MAEETTTDQTTEPETTGRVLTQAQLDKAIQIKTAAHQRALDAVRAELAAAKAEREQLAAALAKYESQGKSAEQIFAEQQQTWEKQRQALTAQLLQEKATTETERARRRDETFNARLLAAVSGAKHPARAALLARHEIPGLGVDDDGRLTLVDPSTELPGDAQEAIKAWLKASPDLLPASGGGPPTSGGVAAGTPARKHPFEGVPPGAAQIDVALQRLRAR